MTRRLVAAVTALCAALLLAGCAPSPAASPTPTVMTRAQALAAAEATYRAYIDALNKVDLSDPATFEDVYQWETGGALASDMKVFTGYAAQGAHVSGKSNITLLSLRSFEGDSSTIELDACVDVRTIDVTDPSGHSLIAPDREDVHPVIVEVTRDHKSPTAFFLSAITGREDGPKCA